MVLIITLFVCYSDLPLKKISELFSVNNFIVVQCSYSFNYISFKAYTYMLI